ncbi:GNAT family N-acetyltransferase [Streptomyces sp. NPDC048275]|uniref:GNAT family N-acetyltransferase n=1 Tax=Streptomyces sp. NPDC048275 TaxID=3155629 RepID=UPI003406D8B8
MGVGIRTAGEGDRELVTRLLDEAFQGDPVSRWIFPDAAHRGSTHPRLMGMFLDIVLAEGRVDVTEDGAACALWLSVPAAADGDHADEGDGPAQLRAAVDPDNERVELVGRLTDRAHPVGRAHEYLWLIAVTPDRQGEGLGTALMQPVLDRCDRTGLPAYLEASSARSRELYERLGFVFTGRTVDLPDGPPMWPMWREPQGEPEGESQDAPRGRPQS